jgi:hypothetical protein
MLQAPDFPKKIHILLDVQISGSDTPPPPSFTLGDDPFTSKNELHCNGQNQLSDDYPEKGSVGNLCHIDCSNRGVCDYRTGTCNCFKGSYGSACHVTSRTGRYKDAASAPAEDYAPPFSSDNSSAYQQIELGVDDVPAGPPTIIDRRLSEGGGQDEAEYEMVAPDIGGKEGEAPPNLYY